MLKGKTTKKACGFCNNGICKKCRGIKFFAGRGGKKTPCNNKSCGENGKCTNCNGQVKVNKSS